MSKRTKLMITNYVMLAALIVAMVTGFLAKPFPSMWMGISHALSSVILTIGVIVHCFQHRPKKKNMVK